MLLFFFVLSQEDWAVVNGPWRERERESARPGERKRDRERESLVVIGCVNNDN
jgi:hypothetical protein